MTCPGTPHRGHFHEDEPCPIVDARGIPAEKAYTTGDVLVEYFFTARYRGACVLNPDHIILPGDQVGKAVEAADLNVAMGTICTPCLDAVTA